MYKKLFLSCVFLIATLTLTQFAAADYRITNGSATEEAWVSYSAWTPASGGWQKGWRTQGWGYVEPGATLHLSIPQKDSKWVYIRVKQLDGTEIKPFDHATRDKYPFLMHPFEDFTVVMSSNGEFLQSSFDRSSLEPADHYKYRNGGSHTIADEPSLPDLPQQIYDQAMPSVVWIENFDGESQGSGVLVDQERKLVVTNQHVTEAADFVFVSFPVRDWDGKLIDDRDYYRENYLSLTLNGYGTWARVIAEDAERDVAILQLDFLYENSREINHDFGKDFSRNMNKNEIVHLMGNPGSTDLWDWKIGSFQSDDGRMINIHAQAYDGRGSSGGPVLNAQGILIGIIQSGTGKGWIGAVPARYIKDLLDTVRPKHTFQIENDTSFTIHYRIRWSRNGNWKQYSLEAGRELYHWLPGGDVSQGFPEILFDAVVNDGQFTPRFYALNTFLRYFGSNYADHVSYLDSYGYIFNYNRATREIDLFSSQNAGCVPMDVNGDGQTNLRDLDFIAERIGTLRAGAADVDQDGDVDISDMVFAAALFCGTASPSVNQDLAPTLTAANLQIWINQAKQLSVSDPIFQRGIAVLEQLLAGLTQVKVIPVETLLLTNYPNPFNPETWIPYQLAKPAKVTVTIHSADGRLVRTLALGHQPAGVYQRKGRAAYWDGKNERGEPVASGLYFYTLTADDFTATRKMLIVK